MTGTGKATARGVFFVLLCAMTVIGHAAESCDLESIGLTKASPLPQKLFYTGTCHYRNEDYAAAAEVWQKLAALEPLPEQYRELQVSSLNNLGFLMFFGDGIDKDQQQAVAYWEKAATLGQPEAEYHLCHAYADARDSTYAPGKAAPHCDRAESYYATIKEPGRNDQIILSQIRGYKTQLANVIRHK